MAKSVYVIRKAEVDDIRGISELLVRLKKLNGEFEPMFKVVSNVIEEAESYTRETMGSDKDIVLVAKVEKKIVGLIKAVLKDRRFYEPVIQGIIVDLYVLPENRRGKLGEDLLNSMMNALKQRGVEIVTAEFPTQNTLAINFYQKQGFRALVSTFAKTFPNDLILKKSDY